MNEERAEIDAQVAATSLSRPLRSLLTPTTTHHGPLPSSYMLRQLFHRPLQGDQPQDAVVGRVIRRKVVTNLLWRHLSVLRFAVPAVLYFVHALSLTRIILLLIGYVWMLALPLPELSQSTYIDENALQPAQVLARSFCCSTLLSHG